uniref:Uncharacterized protein n=1 Tax=Oryza barthii TaxID=65489 RepID=A0A0D3G5H7_9ORYZ
MVAAALRSRGPKRDFGNRFMEAVFGGEHGGQQASALRRECRGGAGVVRGSQGRSVSPCRFGHRLWQRAAAPGWRGALRGRLCRQETRRQGRRLCRRQTQVGGFADGGSNGRVCSVSSLRAEGRRRFGAVAARASGRGRAEASSALHNLVARFTGRGGMGGLEAMTFGSHPMSARKEMGKRRREGWGAGPLAGGVQGAWAH